MKKSNAKSIKSAGFAKRKNKKEKAIEEKIKEEPLEEIKNQDFTPEIEEAEEEKQFIKEDKFANSNDFTPESAFDSDFEEILPSIGTRSNVSLDRLNSRRENAFNLEEFLENSPLNKPPSQSWQEEFDPKSYISGIKNSDEPKYLDYGGNFNPVEKINSSFNAFEERKAEFMFNPMHKQEEKSIETYVPVQKTDIDKLGKKKTNPFDDFKEVKYTPGKY